MSLTTDVQKLYVAFFNRPADFEGLNYWVDQATQNGGNTANVANAFSASAEYKAIYTGMSAYQTINTVYLNLFGRPAELGGLTFWGDALSRGVLTLANIAIGIANGAQNDDLVALNNKITAATSFTANLDTVEEVIGYSGDAANAVAKAWLSTITSTTATADLTDAALLNAAIAKTVVAAAVYTITPSSTTIDEGATATFAIAAKNVADGTVLTYAFSGTGLTADDITGGLTGTVTVTGGKASISLPAIADKTTEGAEIVTVTFTDQATSVVVKTASITINDTSANTAPTFSSSTAIATVKENVTTVYTAKATDAEGQTVTYTLAGVDAATFAIDASTGAVTFVTAPNYEVDAKTYNFDVVASDGMLSKTQSVTVNVTDVNEAPTYVATSNTKMTVAENSTATISNTAALATDVDASDAITYSLSGADSALFTVSATGAISFTAGANFEALGSAAKSNAYSVNLVATDKAGLTAVQAETITVTNVNEAPTFKNATAALTVAENSTAAATDTAAAGVASDVDASDTLTYTLSGTDSALFTVDKTTGAINFTTAANFEALGSAAKSNSYSLNLVATDAAGLSATQAVTVAVTDVNEAPTFAAASSTMTVGENSTAAITAVAALATDVDASDAITYSLSGTDSAMFNVSSAGAISFKAAADFETPGSSAKSNSYSVNLVATDKAGLSAVQAETITVTNANEAPTFKNATAALTVAENSTAAATDTATAGVASDVDASDTLTYTLSGADSALFSVSSAGAISFKTGANFEGLGSAAKSNTYSLNMIATDAGGLSATQTVTVDVTNVNEAPTAIAVTAGTLATAGNNNTYRVKLTELLAGATDVDAGSVLTVASVAAIASTGNGTPGIIGDEVVFVATAGARTGSFTYTVTDAGGLTSSNTVTMSFNSAPVITASQTLAVTEAASGATTKTGTVLATDNDSDTMTYTLSGTNGGATKGTVVITDAATGAYTYTYTGASGAVAGALAAAATDADTITFIATDTKGSASAAVAVAVTTTGVDNAPANLTTQPTAIAAKSGSSYTVDLSKYASDPDTASPTWALTSATTTLGGSVTVTSAGIATVTYAQGGGTAALGADTFGFTVTDASANTATGSVTATVTNTAPTAAAITSTTSAALGTLKAGQTATIDVVTLGGADADSNTMTPAIVIGSLTKGGSAEIVSGKVLYTPTIGYVGNESFSYTIADGFGGTATGTVTVTVVSNTGGTSGDDNLYGSSAAEAIDGLAGNDTIVGGGGLDTISGGDGNDIVTFSDGASNIQGGANIDTLVVNSDAVTSKFDLSQAGQQNSGVIASGTSGSNSLNAKVVIGGFENIDATKASSGITLDQDAIQTTSIVTGSGADALTFLAAGSTGTISVSSNDGNDTITATASAAKMSIDGGAGNDSISGSAQNDTLIGGAGNDTITSGTGIDSVSAGDGDDRLILGANLVSTDTVSGGSGTDVLSVSGTRADVDFTLVTSVETLTSETGGAFTAVSLGALAAAAGISTITFNVAGTADVVTIGSGFTSALTVNNEAASTVANTVSAAAYTGALTINATATAMHGVTQVFTGGTGTADSLKISIDANSKNADVTSVTGIETISVIDGDTSSTHTVTVALADGNATYTSTAAYQTITVDASTLSVDIAMINAVSEADGKVVIKGGSAADMITISASANFGDSITGGNGNDTVSFTVANLTSLDTIDGGSGTDTLAAVNAASLADASFTAVTSFETLTNTTTALTASLGAKAMATGIATTSFGFDGVNALTVGSGFTSAMTVNFAATDAAANTVNASAASNVYTGALTVAALLSAVDTSNHSITGGSGTSDTLKISVDSSAAVVAGTMTNLLNVETIQLIDGNTASTHTASVALNNANATFSNTSTYQTVTVDASALSVDIAAINAVAEVDGKVVIKGGSAADLITISASANFGDSITGGNGNDTFGFTVANLTSLDTIDGGSGTDILTAADGALISDAAFTKVTSVETLTDTTTVLQASVGALAAASGLATVTFGFDALNLLTVGSGFSSALSVGFAATDTTANSIIASAYTGALTVTALLSSFNTAAHTITGGTGTTDVLKISVDADTTTSATPMSTLTNVETIQLIDGNTSSAHTATVVLHENNATYTSTTAYQTITVDASALVADIVVINAAGELDGKVVLKGGSAADLITISGSANFGDSIDAGAGNDTIAVPTLSKFTSTDTISGGAGTDTLSLTTASVAVTDAMFTGLTLIETLSTSDDNTQSITLGTKAVTAGIVTVTAAATTTTTKAVTIDLSGMVGSAGVSVTGGSGSDQVLGSTGNDSISGGAIDVTTTATTANDVLTGGSGADIITLGTSGSHIIKLNLNADVATGTTLASADQWANFVTGKTKVDLSGTTIMTTGGTILALTNGAVASSAATAGTMNDSVAKDDMGSTTAARFLSSGTVSDFANLGALTNQGVMIFKLTTDIVTGTTSGVSNTLLNQAGVTEAVTYISANIGTATVANTNVFFYVNDGTNSALFQYQEGALDQGISASELTLVGVFTASTTLAVGDIV